MIARVALSDSSRQRLFRDDRRDARGVPRDVSSPGVSRVARLFGAAPCDREDDAESSDSSDDDQDRAAKAARATGSTTIPDVAVFQVLAFWLGDAKTL